MLRLEIHFENLFINSIHHGPTVLIWLQFWHCHPQKQKQQFSKVQENFFSEICNISELIFYLFLIDFLAEATFVKLGMIHQLPTATKRKEWRTYIHLPAEYNVRPQQVFIRSVSPVSPSLMEIKILFDWEKAWAILYSVSIIYTQVTMVWPIIKYLDLINQNVTGTKSNA